jgi:hypothetical protein
VRSGQLFLHKISLMLTRPPRENRLYQNLIGNKEWMDDLQNADVIFFATHSQGSIVSTHILDHLITDGHIRTAPRDLAANAIAVASGGSITRPPQRVCCLALCGIHLGPLRYLSTSSLVLPYIQVSHAIPLGTQVYIVQPSTSSRLLPGSCSNFR